MLKMKENGNFMNKKFNCINIHKNIALAYAQNKFLLQRNLIEH